MNNEMDKNKSKHKQTISNIVLLSIIIILIPLGYFLYKNDFFLKKPQVFAPCDDTGILLEKDDNIHFYSKGFAISGKDTTFFNFSGQKIEPPFTENDIKALSGPITVDQSTNRYMLINQKFLFDTATIPFKMVLELPAPIGWGLKEFKDFLILTVRDDKGIIQPWLVQKGNNSMVKIENMSDLNYLDCDYSNTSKGISILSVNTDNPFPSTKILHMDTQNRPYGILSLDDQMFYRIYRENNHVILASLYEIVCYDISGSKIWSLKIPRAYQHQYINMGQNKALYFNDIFVDGPNNTLIITPDGKYEFMALPKYLYALKTYKDGFVAIQGDKSLVFLNGKGEISNQYSLEENILDVFWTQFNENYIYTITHDRKVKIYKFMERSKGDEK
ncbi:hypothetical protein [Xylanivirga thermophila]|uniref:hypothetical protein n=1 Tax=Xylanivirga thermophila TaxID=2496273 RepID=UPI00101D39E2|nr:hypothetical protein [Xylanivirga thermophila]